MPPAIAQRLIQLRGTMSRKEFAEILGTHVNTLGNYERGERTPDVSFAATVCRKLNISPLWLIAGEGPMKSCESSPEPAVDQACDVDLIYVPMVKARLAAGTGSFETSAEVERRYAFRSDFLNSRGHPREMVLMRVMGDSMEPEIKDDDVVLIDQSQKQPGPGQVFAVGVEDLVYLKMIDALPGRLVLKSYNPAYAPIEVETSGDLADGVRIIGHVIWVGRELR